MIPFNRGRSVIRRQLVGSCALGLLLAAGAGCKPARREVVVFAAASLARAFAELEQEIERKNTALEVRVEPSGSQEACRKIAELNHRADVVATADYRVIESILRPDHAAFNIQFTTNEIVLAHMQHSKHTELITALNWPSILLRSDVRLGRVAPDQAPIGYATLLVWQLAELHLGKEIVGEDLPEHLRARCAKEHVTSDESELLQLLQSRAIDYAFVYRSTAEDHNLKVVRLPDSYNLGAADKRDSYSRAMVRVQMKKSEASREIRGAPLTYGLTIPRSAPNPDGAAQFVSALLGQNGRRILQRYGFRPLSPARSAGPKDLLPPWLRSFHR